MGGRKTYFGGKHRDMIMLDPSLLEVEPDPQRDEISIEEAMVQSILAHGVEEPLLVMRDGDKLKVVAGRRRRVHAIEASKRQPKGSEPILVPVILVKGDEASIMEKAIIENFHRQNPSPLGTAKAMQRLIDLGRDKKRLAMIFNCTEQTVTNTLQVLDLAAPVQRAVESGKVAVTVARELHKLPREEQTTRLGKMLESGATKGAVAKKVARGAETGDKQRVCSRVYLERFRDELREESRGGECGRMAALIDFVLGDDGALNKCASSARDAVERLEKKAKDKA
jgi:ParB family transcriptional regulator, chromosome partitioning protein